MALMDFAHWLKTSRRLPSPVGDGLDIRARGARYGELVALAGMSPQLQHADEGASFVATNPTPGSALAYGSGGTQASFSDTVPFMLIKNNYQAGGGARRVFLDSLKLIQITGTAPATTTSVQASVRVDSKDRTPSAGTISTITPVNVNMDDDTPSGALVLVPTGAVATIPASGQSMRQVGRAQLKGGPTLVLDEYALHFGPHDIQPQGGYLTTVAAYVSSLPVVEIGPQQWAVIHLWFPGGATNPFTYEFELRLRER